MPNRPSSRAPPCDQGRHRSPRVWISSSRAPLAISGWRVVLPTASTARPTTAPPGGLWYQARPGRGLLAGISVAQNGDIWLAGGFPDGIYRSTDDGATWGPLVSGPSGQGIVNGISIAPNGDLWLAGSSPDGIYRSTDDGATWGPLVSGPSGQGIVTGISIAPNGDLWLAGGSPDGIYRSTDDGATWGSLISPPSGQSAVNGISIAPNGDLWLAGGSPDGIYRSTDDGATWGPLVSGPSGQTSVQGIAFDRRATPIQALVAVSSGVPDVTSSRVDIVQPAVVARAAVRAGVPAIASQPRSEFLAAGRSAVRSGAPTLTARVEVAQPAVLARAAVRSGAPAIAARSEIENPAVVARAAVRSGVPTVSARGLVEIPVPPVADRHRAEALSLSGRAPIYAIEITHPIATIPVRMVADAVEHTIEGNTYGAIAFSVVPPQDKEGEIRQASLQIDNVGRELMQWIEKSQGGRGATMRVMQVRPPAPGEAESDIAWENTMSVGVTEADNGAVMVSLTDEPLFGRPAVLLRHDPDVSPGLF